MTRIELTDMPLHAATAPADGVQTIVPPSHFLCPLTLDVMNDPVDTPHGHSFERTAILAWIRTQRPPTVPAAP